MDRSNVDVYPDIEQLSRSVAKLIQEWSATRIRESGRFTIALAGGSTPKALYRYLSDDEFRDQLDWEQFEIFMGDERYVPLDHEDSNFRMVRESLLDHVPVQDHRVHPVPTHLDPADAARAYEATIREVFAVSAPDVPVFDLILLGIGPDGHTASLFPETDALSVKDRLVVENWVPQQNAMRITFTIPMLTNASRVVLLAAGQEKADAVAQAIEAPRNLIETPSQCLRDAQGDVMLVLEHQAATKLSSQARQ